MYEDLNGKHYYRLNNLLEPQRRLIEQFSKITAPQRKMMEQLTKVTEPQRRIMEQLARATEPQRRIMEQLAKAVEPQKRIMEQLAKAAEPQKRIMEQLAKAVEPQKRIMEQLARATEPQRRMIEQLANISEPQRRMIDQIAKFTVSQKHQRGQVDKIIKFQKVINDSFKLESTIDGILGTAKINDLMVNPNGTISIGNKNLTISDFSETYMEFVETIEKLPSQAQILEFIQIFLQKLKKPVAIILMLIILPYINNIASNLSFPYVEEIIKSIIRSPKEQIKLIKNEVQQEFLPDFLKTYRFVSASVLNVRKGPSSSYQVVDEISFGKIVRLIQKGRQWPSIEYLDEDTEEIVTGWVFNRYLNKFK